MAKDVKKVVLAYSGGLDTSIILKWLQETYGCEVVTFTADLGQGEELAPAREKALAMGVKPENIFIDDLREEFVRDFVFPMFRANTLYEGQYLLGTSIARPLIAKRQIEIANLVGADAVCHGATGKGNDQVRFEVSLLCAEAGREGDRAVARVGIRGPPRSHRLRQEARHPDRQGQGAGRAVLDRRELAAHVIRRASCWKIRTSKCRTSSPSAATAAPSRRKRRRIRPRLVTLSFERGDLVAIDGKAMKAHELLAELNRLGAEARHRRPRSGRESLCRHEVARLLRNAGRHDPLARPSRNREHHARSRRHALKDELMPKYASLIYNGFWWTPERLDAAGRDRRQPGERHRRCEAEALQRRRARRRARSSPYSLYSKKLVGFDEAGGYNQADAEGFIKLNALRLRILAERDRKAGKNE